MQKQIRRASNILFSLQQIKVVYDIADDITEICIFFYMHVMIRWNTEDHKESKIPSGHHSQKTFGLNSL